MPIEAPVRTGGGDPERTTFPEQTENDDLDPEKYRAVEKMVEIAFMQLEGAFFVFWSEEKRRYATKALVKKGTEVREGNFVAISKKGGRRGEWVGVPASKQRAFEIAAIQFCDGIADIDDYTGDSIEWLPK